MFHQSYFFFIVVLYFVGLLATIAISIFAVIVQILLLDKKHIDHFMFI